jgi:hypothetical protein
LFFPGPQVIDRSRGPSWCRYEQPWNEEKVPSIGELLEETRAQCPDIAAAENVFAAHDYWWLDLPKKT